jgi:hypothetical protein
MSISTKFSLESRQLQQVFNLLNFKLIHYVGLQRLIHEFVFTGLDVIITIPRRCGRQLYRVNIAASTPEDYFRLAVFIPFLDHFLVQMDDRLLAHRNLLTCFSSLLPNKDICSKGFDSSASKQASILFSTYSTHLECGEAEFLGEMQLYYKHISKLSDSPRNALNALTVIYGPLPYFQNFHVGTFLFNIIFFSPVRFVRRTYFLQYGGCWKYYVFCQSRLQQLNGASLL